MNQLPDYGKLNFAQKSPQPLETVVPRANENPSFLHLLEKLLVLDPSQRISAETSLQMDCFAFNRSDMQDELIPNNLLEPLLLSNPNNDVSIASRKALQLATAKRNFLKSLHYWSDAKSIGVPSLHAQCEKLCKDVTIGP